jgi:hypothetical protein
MVIFGMIGLSTLASVVVLGVLYGYFAGLSEYFFLAINIISGNFRWAHCYV